MSQANADMAEKEGRGGGGELLTLAYKGGGLVGEMLTLADKAVRGV